MNSPSDHPALRNPAGFALISVLALVSLAALSATAFLAAARLEKAASLSTGDQTRLTMALDSGYHLGSYPVSRGDHAWNWVTFLLKETNANNANFPGDTVGYLFHGEPSTNQPGVWSNYALFSCANITNLNPTSNLSLGFSNLCVTTTNQGGFAAARFSNNSPLMKMVTFNTNTANDSFTRIPLLFGRTSLPVAWITNYVTNPSATNQLMPTYRFAYFTEDMSGLIDAERMGGTTNRTTGTDPAEISLLEIGISNLPAFIGNRNLFVTPGMIQQILRSNNLVAAGAAVTNPWRYLAGSFYSMNGMKTTTNTMYNGLQRIPVGLGYGEAENTNSAKKKYNLNDFFSNGLATPTALNTIVSAISSNLPAFAGTRAGGFILTAGGGATNTNAYTTNAYLQTLAASIIDYADTDSTPTTDGTILSTNRDRPAYRGVDSHPFVNEYATRFNLFSTNTTSVGGTTGRAIVIQSTDYVELWNPSNLTNSGTLTFVAINRQPLAAGFANFNFTNPLWATNAKGIKINGGISSNSTNVTLKPNEFLVIDFPTVTNCFFYPANNLTLPLDLGPPNNDINSSYRVAWNNVYYDGALGNLKRISKKLALNAPKWSATIPGFVGSDLTPGSFKNMSGDPRAVIYQSFPQDAVNYDANSSFGGRNSRSGIAQNQPYKEVKPSLWPDGGHDSPAGPATGSDAKTPNLGTGPNYTNSPVSRVSNAGFYSNVCEIGSVFDPIQWFDTAGKGASSGFGSDGGQWTNLTPAGIASNVYGGGTTLRIGRAEYSRFAWTNWNNAPVAHPNMAASAAALLDIFCATTNNPAYLSGRFDDGDQININTAPPRVLRALAAGVVLSNHPGLKPSNNFAIPASAVDNFVKGVTNFRARYPFYSASQLAFIGTDASWPNTNTWPAGAVFTSGGAGFTEGSDAAVEEWFSKIHALSKVQSRNFRIYVQAQLIKTRGTNTNPNTFIFSSMGRRYYDVFNQQTAQVPPSCSVFLLRKVDY